MINRTSFLFGLFIVLCLLLSLVSAQSNQRTLPQAVVNAMASRRERTHHFLWHNIRENWNRFSSNTQNEIRNLDWAPPRPGRRFDSNGNALAINDNNSGEDFLFMHRQMIGQVNRILSNSGGSYGRVRGWTTFPAPGDSVWPTPSSYTIPGSPTRTGTMNRWKTTNFYNNNIRSLERTFTDPDELRQMTLGELGARIEVTVHGWHHLKFSERSSYGYRPSTSSAFPEISERWDNPQYDWLVDTYSSHVNPAFWKIHGWVDDRIDDWRRANGLSSIRWRGTWEGGPMSRVSNLWDNKETKTSLRVHGHGKKDPEEEDVMEKLVKIFAKEGVPEVSFADPVFLDNSIPMKKSKRRLCKANPIRKRR